MSMNGGMLTIKGWDSTFTGVIALRGTLTGYPVS